MARKFQRKGAIYKLKVLVFSNGVTKEITGDAGKYWLCGEERFRKAGKQFLEVRDIPEEEKNSKKRTPPEKKKTAKKKKAAEVTEDGERDE